MLIFKKNRKWFEIATRKDIFKRSLKIALIVGSILALLNHGDKIISARYTINDIIKILITYLVPFCVSTYSSVAYEINNIK